MTGIKSNFDASKGLSIDAFMPVNDAPELAQKIMERAQEAYNTSPHYPSVLSRALEDIIELCKERIEKGL